MLSNLKRTTRECVHYRSRDKDGGHTIRSATAENPMLYARKLHEAKNRSYCRLMFYIAENKEFRAYRACKLFNIHLSATLCFNYFQ